MTLYVFNWVLSIIIWLLSFVLNIVFSVLPIAQMPNLTGATNVLNSFWEYVFSAFSWVCNALCLSPIHINLIIDILTIKYLAKPTITIVKILLNWIFGGKEK